MNENTADTQHESEPSREMSQDDQRAVNESGGGSAKVVHEIVRLKGDEELDRPIRSLLLSGFTAGLAIGISVLSEAFLYMRLPDTPWRELIVSFGYTTGFIVVILGKLQLFTENTVTAVLPVATHSTSRNFVRLLRLWAAVFLANMAGTLVVSILIAKQIIVGSDELKAAIEVSKPILEHDPTVTLLLGTPAGFLIAAIAWTLPNAKGSEFFLILMITYVISIGGFTHVVAGSVEAWLLMLSGQTSAWGAIAGFIVPALIGNIIGGTGLFAFLAHGQVRDEIKPN
jgi:formate/nitrite transporter FocA (FNT family)